MSKQKNELKLSKQEAQGRLDKLVPKLKSLPAFTERYHNFWVKCEELIKIVYPNQYVLATKNFDSTMQHNTMSFITHAFQHSIDKVGYVPYEKIHYLLKRRPLETEGMFRYIERHKLEYNFAFKQINAFTFIHDGEYAIVLYNPYAKKRRYSLPGGHVDFDNSTYQRSMIDNIRQGAITEVCEELNFKKCEMGIDDIKANIRPMMYANYDSDWNKFFHSAFIFECKVDNVRQSFEAILSGEPDRHGVEIIKLSDMTIGESKCSWLDSCVDYLAKREKGELSLDL